MNRDTGASRIYVFLPDMQLPTWDVALQDTKNKEQLVEIIVNKIKTDIAKIRNTIKVTGKDLIPLKVTNECIEEWTDLKANQKGQITFRFINLRQWYQEMLQLFQRTQMCLYSSWISFPLVTSKRMYWCNQHLLIVIKWLISLQPSISILLLYLTPFLLMVCLDAIQWVVILGLKSLQ